MVRGQQRLGYDYFTATDFQSLDTMFAGVTAGICQRVAQTLPDQGTSSIVRKL